MDSLNTVCDVIPFLSKGISLKQNPQGLHKKALLYKHEYATALDIITAIERDEVRITKFPRKTRSSLLETFLAGFAHDHEYPIRWSKSTKWP